VPPPDASRQLYRLLQRLQLVLVLAGRRAWAGMDPDDFDSSWRRVAPALVAVTAAAQLAAARAASEYVPVVLAETGQPDAPLARVRSEAFAGRASDGRSLVGLLTGAVVHAKRAAQSRTFELEDGEIVTLPGLSAGDALARGGRWLDTALRTATMDAARDATQAEIITRQDMGWVRMINPPCCTRCAVLAGRWYSWKADFDRHPGCDCTAIPASENVAGDFTVDSRLLVDRGLITDLTRDQKKRLAEGSNLNKVLNESRDRWRVRMAADRRRQGPVDRAGRSRGANWTGWSGGGSNPPPPGTTIHELMDKLRSDVSRHQAAAAMRAAGIAT
jgi:hypothetical protein